MHFIFLEDSSFNPPYGRCLLTFLLMGSNFRRDCNTIFIMNLQISQYSGPQFLLRPAIRVGLPTRLATPSPPLAPTKLKRTLQPARFQLLLLFAPTLSSSPALSPSLCLCVCVSLLSWGIICRSESQLRAAEDDGRSPIQQHLAGWPRGHRMWLLHSLPLDLERLG